MPALLILLSIVGGYINNHGLKKKRNFSPLVKHLALAHGCKPYGHSCLEPGEIPLYTLTRLVIWLRNNEDTAKTIIDYIEEKQDEQK